MNIGESLPRNAQHFPDKHAIVDAHRTLTYREFHERTNRLANCLLAQDIRKGDLVGLSCGSRAEHFEALFALAKIGAVAVPFDFNWSALECEAMLGFFAPKAFFLETRKETDALTKLAREHVQRNNLLVINSSSSAHAETCMMDVVVHRERSIRGTVVESLAIEPRRHFDGNPNVHTA